MVRICGKRRCGSAVTLMLLATALAIGFHRQALEDDFLDQSEAMRDDAGDVRSEAENTRPGEETEVKSTAKT